MRKERERPAEVDGVSADNRGERRRFPKKKRSEFSSSGLIRLRRDLPWERSIARMPPNCCIDFTLTGYSHLHGTGYLISALSERRSAPGDYRFDYIRLSRDGCADMPSRVLHVNEMCPRANVRCLRAILVT